MCEPIWLRYLKPTPYPSEKIGRSPSSHGGIPSSLHPSGGLPRSPFSNTKSCMDVNAESQLCMRSNVLLDLVPRPPDHLKNQCLGLSSSSSGRMRAPRPIMAMKNIAPPTNM